MSSTEEKQQPQAKRGRGDRFPGGRDAILDAAREQFAAKGYSRATIRSIAAQAGVDPALVMHFFSTKDELFAAALTLPVETRKRLLDALQSPADEVPRNLVDTYIQLWEDTATSARFRATLLSISTSEDAVRQLRAMLEGGVNELAGRHRPEAVTTAMSQLLGAAIARYVIRVPPLADLTPEEFGTQLLPGVRAALQDALGGDLSPAPMKAIG